VRGGLGAADDCAKVEAQELLKDKWYVPYLDTSVRALPHHYCPVPGKNGELIRFNFLGATQKTWYLRHNDGWQLLKAAEGTPNCEVSIKDDYAWRIFTKGIQKAEAVAAPDMKGKYELGIRGFELTAVMG